MTRATQAADAGKIQGAEQDQRTESRGGNRMKHSHNGESNKRPLKVITKTSVEKTHKGRKRKREHDV